MFVENHIYIFKDLFIFITKPDIWRGGETERKIFRSMIHSPSERNGSIPCRSEGRSLFRVSHMDTGSQGFGLSLTAFPSHMQGAGWEAGLPGLEPASIWDASSCKARTLATRLKSLPCMSWHPIWMPAHARQGL